CVRGSAYIARMTEPLAFFITFACYGTWLHGDPRGSVDRDHSTYGTPYLPPDRGRCAREQAQLRASPYLLDASRRQVVLEAILALARRKAWRLWAVHVRSNHVHVVISAGGAVERV